MVVMFGGMAFAYFWIQTQTGSFSTQDQAMITSKLLEILLLVCLTRIVFISVVAPLLSTMKIQLGTDGKHFRIRLADSRELMINPADIANTDRPIYYRQNVLPLRGGNHQKLYEDGEIETWIAPLLRNAQKITEWQGLKHRWEHQNAQLIWPLLGGLAGAFLCVVWLYVAH